MTWMVCDQPRLEGTSANTRNGLPLPSRIFSGAATISAPVAGKQIEIAQALQSVFAGAVHVVVTRVGRLEVRRLPRVGADGFGAEAEHIALVHQKAHAVWIGTGRVLAGVVEILIGDGVDALRPVGAHQHPRPGGNAAMALLPGGEMVDGEQEIGVGARLRAAIDHAGRRDEMLDRQRIDANCSAGRGRKSNESAHRNACRCARRN